MSRLVPIERLILVYNANSGLLAATADSFKKILRLKGCTLCAITHGLTGEKDEWASCKEALGVPLDYVHRDEIEGPLVEACAGGLPCVVAVAGGDHQLLLGPDVLERCHGSVSDLKGRLLYRAGMKGLTLGGAEVGAEGGAEP